ncbi:MAG: hypothetical protein GOVbin4162_42 [Prokaryotic dsDNA virus sp.]|nr:MAG: hypothetical protein GOVbin4162_42 [Prokaryotic dsDNA virus sp.]|tara:strand:- start:2940 stop:3620 length:681 start_codon:yes stop_codon:yes gene_type:complete
MAIGIQTSVSPYEDFDDLFEQRISGDPTVATTGVQTSGGSDISNRYVPLSFGGTAIANDTGVQNSAGDDCRDLFAGIGTVTRVQAPWDGLDYSVSSLESGSSTARAILTFSLNNDKSFLFDDSGSSTNTISGIPVATGDWLDSGSVSSYEARVSLVFDINNGGQINNEMSSFVSLGTSRSLVIDCANNLGVTQKAGTATVEVRRSSDNQIVSTSTFSFDVRAEGTS